MSTPLIQATYPVEDEPMDFSFCLDYTRPFRAEDEWSDHGLRLPIQLIQPVASYQSAFSGAPTLPTLGNQTFNPQPYTLGTGFPGPHDYGYPFDQPWTMMSSSSDDDQGLQLPRPMLQRSQSALNFPVDAELVASSERIPPELHWPTRPRSVPSTLNTDSPRQQTVETPAVKSSNATEMLKWGYRVNNRGDWACNFPRCRSTKTFHRACDLRKHYNRHNRKLYCRKPDCSQHNQGGFATIKDRARHEASHNPVISCEDEGCSRVFSRKDNMRDHLRRRHIPKDTSDIGSSQSQSDS